METGSILVSSALTTVTLVRLVRASKFAQTRKQALCVLSTQNKVVPAYTPEPKAKERCSQNSLLAPTTQPLLLMTLIIMLVCTAGSTATLCQSIRPFLA